MKTWQNIKMSVNLSKTKLCYWWRKSDLEKLFFLKCLVFLILSIIFKIKINAYVDGALPQKYYNFGDITILDYNSDE